MAVEVKVKHKESGETLNVSYDFGATLQEAIDRYGEDVVFENFIVRAKTALRNFLDKGMNRSDDANWTPEEARGKVSDWVLKRPSERAAKDPVQALLSKVGEMGADELTKLITTLMQKQEELEA